MPEHPPVTWPYVLSALVGGRDLSVEESAWAMREILGGEASSAQIAGFCVALRAKGETASEIEGLVEAMYAHAATVVVPGRTLDIVGTGGDRANTVNISTMAALVAAGAGARVAKHGNRSASSACGAADLLEELGVPLELTPAEVAKLVDEVGITFCFAPRFHPALRHAAQARRELGIATSFNFLGPLANPAKPRAQAVGVADARMAPLMAAVCADRGVDAVVFRGDDGLDELTTSTTSQVWSTTPDGSVRDERLDPRVLGLAPVPVTALRGGDAAHNARVCHEVLAGVRGPVRDVVVLNAAAGLAAWEPSEASINERVGAGLERAAHSVDSGAARAVLDRWIAAAAPGEAR